MAKLQAKIDRLEDVAEALREFYTKQDDDTFALDLDGAEDVTGLKTALVKERKSVKDLNAELSGFKKLGETPDEIQATIDAAETADDKGTKVTESREYILLQQKLDQTLAQNETLEAEVKSGRTASQRVIRKSALQQALVEAKATSTGMKLLTNELAGRIQVEIGEDGSSSVTVTQSDGETPMVGSGADGSATVADLVKSVGMKEYPELFQGDGKGGSGKPPSSGGSGGGGGKSMTRSEFDALSPQEQGRLGAEIAKGDVTVTAD